MNRYGMGTKVVGLNGFLSTVQQAKPASIMVLHHGELHMTLHAPHRGLTAVTSHFLLLAAVLAVATQLLAQGPPPGNQPPPPPPTAGINATLDSDGSSATYIVTEQLVGINFPNDAEGTNPTSPATSSSLRMAASLSAPPSSPLTCATSRATRISVTVTSAIVSSRRTNSQPLSLFRRKLTACQR